MGTEVNATIKVLHEVTCSMKGDCVLCFQHCVYHYTNDREKQEGYRFIWRNPDGKLLAVRGQTRIPSTAILLALVNTAIAAGWGNIDADKDVLDIEPEEQK